MYKVVYKNKARIKQKYIELFQRIDVQQKWDNLVLQPQYSSLATLLPHGLQAKDLLTADFKTLVRVYKNFERYIARIPNQATVDDIKAHIVTVFNYKSAQSKIADFLIHEIKNLHHHCYYCDSRDISSYTDEDGVKHHYFEIEHILDKGACPMVGLSLFNFVPSCHHCNHDLKGSTLIGNTLDNSVKLAPTSNSYDFYNKVHFVVNAKPGARSPEVDKRFVADYEIDFEYNNGAYDLYHHVVDKFHLKTRYNEGEIKAEAILLKDLMRQNPPEHIAELARTDQNHRTEAEIYEEIFKEQFRKDNNYKTLKMYNDLLHYHK